MPATLRLALFLCAVSVALPAVATVGEPETATLLGYDPVDDKVFFERTDGPEDTSPPTLRYFVVQDPPPGQTPIRAVVAESWRGPDYDGRRERLVRRLTPLEPTEADGLALEVELGPLVACPGQIAVSAEEAAAAVALAEAPGVVTVGPADVAICQSTRVSLRLGDAAVELPLETWGQVRVQRVDRVPGSGRLVVTVRHRGVTFEGGYDRDEVVLMPEGSSRDEKD